jgi:hypothetical protein
VKLQLQLLKTALIRTKDDTEKVIGAFEALGFSADYIANRSMMSVNDILQDLVPAFADLDGNLRGSVAAALFGKEHFSKLLAVMDNFEKSAKIVTASAEEMAQTFEKELNVRLQSSQISIDKFVNSIENFARVVGDRFKAASVGAVQGTTDIVSALRDMVKSGAFDEIFETLNGFGDDLGATLKGIAQNLPDAFADVDLSGFTNSLIDLRNEFSNVFQGVDLTTVEGLKRAIQGTVNTFTSLVTVTQGMVQSFAPFFKAIAEAISRVNELDKETQKSFGNMLGSAKLIVSMGAEIGLAFAAIQKSGADIKAAFDIVIGSFGSVFNALQATIDQVAASVADKLIGIVTFFEGLSKLGGPAVSKLSNGLTNLREEIEKFEAGAKFSALQNLKEGSESASLAVKGMKNLFGEAKEEVKGLNGELEKVPDSVETSVSVDLDSKDANEIRTLLGDDDFEKRIIVDAEATRALKEIEGVTMEIAEVSSPVLITMDIDGNTKENTIREIVEYKGDIEKAAPEVLVEFEIDGRTLKLTEDQIEELAKTEIKLQADLEKTRIDASLKKLEIDADLMKEKFKYQAEVDIAEAQRSADILSSAFDSVKGIVESTGETIDGLVSNMTDAIEKGQETGDFSAKNEIEKQLDKQNELAEKQLEIQERLVDSEINLNRARQERLESGDAFLKVETEGLQPLLEEVVRNLIEKAKFYGNEEGLEYIIQGASS